MTSVVPALTKPRKPKKLTVTERVTDHGLRVIVVRKPGVPLVELRLRLPFASARATHPARSAFPSRGSEASPSAERRASAKSPARG